MILFPRNHVRRSMSIIFAIVFAAPLQRYPSRVAVAGGTGRLGTQVVRTLLEQTNASVVAMARTKESEDKLRAALGDNDFPPSRLEVRQCDLKNAAQVEAALQDAEALIWCATGFSDSPKKSVFQKLGALFNLVSSKQATVDVEGMQVAASYMKRIGGVLAMCSSAGVTRPTWSAEKKAVFVGAADIPIVRLNPFGILDVKRESEDALRQSGWARRCLQGLRWHPCRPLTRRALSAQLWCPSQDASTSLSDRAGSTMIIRRGGTSSPKGTSRWVASTARMWPHSCVTSSRSPRPTARQLRLSPCRPCPSSARLPTC